MMPGAPRLVRELLGACPTAGNGVHAWIFQCALALRRAGYSEGEMAEMIEGAAVNCGRALEAHEIPDAIKNSGSRSAPSGTSARGGGMPPPPPRRPLAGCGERPYPRDHPEPRGTESLRPLGGLAGPSRRSCCRTSDRQTFSRQSPAVLRSLPRPVRNHSPGGVARAVAQAPIHRSQPDGCPSRHTQVRRAAFTAGPGQHRPAALLGHRIRRQSWRGLASSPVVAPQFPQPPGACGP